MFFTPFMTFMSFFGAAWSGRSADGHADLY